MLKGFHDNLFRLSNQDGSPQSERWSSGEPYFSELAYAAL